MREMIRQAIGSDEAWAAVRYPQQPWRFAKSTGTGPPLTIQAFDAETPRLKLFECKHLPTDGKALPVAPELEVPGQKDYEDMVAEAMRMIRESTLEKVVLSRISPVQQSQADWTSVPDALETAYPDAYNYIVNLPDGGCWMGASPEQLVTRTSEGFKTMALAGTRKKDDLREHPWQAKERTEQDLVRQHIVDSAQNVGAKKIQVTGPVDSAAGHLVHLRSDIRFECDLSTDAVVRVLHPTPAVAGLPVEASLQAIQQLEKHSRGLYAGFMGWADNKVGDEVFVMLRCMRCWQNGAWLYVGGGITVASDPKAEWRETEDKAETLKSVLRMQ